MAITTKTIAGKIVVPGTTVGIRADVTATPMTTAQALTFPDDDTISWGPVVGRTNSSGQLPASFKIPTSQAESTVMWKIEATPVDKRAGLPKSWVMGYYEITGTGTVDLADLVEIDVTLINPGSIVTVQSLVDAAELAAANAATSATAAGTSATVADGHADAASASATTAAGSATAASTSAGQAATSASAASGSATAAAGSATTAGNAATAASGSASAASGSATTAGTHATNAGTSADAAATSATAAQTAETNAETAEANAETAEANAETAATAAAASATAADGSADAAAASATAAAGSATAADSSADAAAADAATIAGNVAAAAASATAADTSADAAAASATAADTSADAAAASATAADTSADEAAVSAQTALDAAADAQAGGVPDTRTVNGQALSTDIVLDQDDIGDGATYKQYSATEKTKLAGIAASATANSSDATLLARANHTGTQSLDTTTDSATRLAMTSAERTKLSGVATGATANSSDATLLARANHTGTQSADTLTDGTTNKAFLATERTKLSGVATGATANSADATLLARANHTGTQAQSTVTNLVTDLAAKAPLASPAFTGTPTGITATHVGLGNVTNTSDANKPVSTAQQALADLKVEAHTFSVTGDVAVATGKSRIYVEGNYTIVSVRASVNTAPTGASLICDVNKNGTTIYSTQSNRPTIAASANTATANSPNTTTLAAGDYLTVDVDQVGSTVAGADLTVTIRLRRTS